MIRSRPARGRKIPSEALRDLRNRRASFFRNPAYHHGRPGSYRRDVEVYGLMLALNVDAELRNITGDAPTFYGSVATDWLSGSAPAELAAAAATPRLAARFWHLLAMQLARVGQDTAVTAELLRLASATEILKTFDVDLQALGAPERAFSVSKFTAAESFRIPELTPDVFSGEDAQEPLRMTMRELRRRVGYGPEAFPDDVDTLIDPAFELVAVIPQLTIRPYAAAEQKVKDDKQKDEDEVDVF